MKVEGKVEVEVAVQRGPDVTGPVTLTVPFLPPNVSALAVTIPPEQSEGWSTSTAAGNASLSVSNVVIVGEMTIGKDKVTLPTVAVPLTIAPK